MKRVLLPIAPGFEEVEAVAVIDVLRRAGVDVVTATTNNSTKTAIEGRCNLKILADTTLNDVSDTSEEALLKRFDMLILPGGAGGTETLLNDKRVEDLIKTFSKDNALIAAICAAPLILSNAGITEGRVVTCHPSVRDKIKAGKITNDKVVVDQNLITSQGPGTAVEFAFTLVEILCGKEKAVEVNRGFLAELS